MQKSKENFPKQLINKKNDKKVAKPIAKARQQEALKKFNRTIQQLKKPNNKISYDGFPINSTLRSKTPSPLKEIHNTEPLFNPTKTKKSSQKKKDEKFIENLFSKSLSKHKNNKKPTVVEHLIQKIITKQRQISLPCEKQSQDKLKSLQLQIINCQKLIAEKDQQIKLLKEKNSLYEETIPIITLNVFQCILIFKKFQSQKQFITIQTVFKTLHRRINSLIQNVNLYVDKFKLQGKIRLKSSIVEKELNQIIHQKEQRALTENYRHLDKNNHQNTRLMHQRSHSSQLLTKKTENLDILIDIISRRDSVQSSRKAHEEQKLVVIKSFQGNFQAHQLHLEKGDRILILKKNEDGWWIGMKNGEVGYFPAQCIVSAS